MPDPKKLKVGDKVKFVSLPDEWRHPQAMVLKESVAFMKVMISRNWPSRVYKIDEYGVPWIKARLRRRGKPEHHWWAIVEKTGWRLVRKRA